MRFAHLESSDLTDAGKLRRNNEDAALCLKAHGVYCVADGMGGAADGEVASRAVIDAYEEGFSGRHSEGQLDFEGIKRLVREAAVNANDWIRDQAENRGAAGMGSTLVVMAFDPASPARGMVAHAGDSRAYRLRGDTLMRLTKDHSLLSEAGIEDRESLGPMFRSMVTRAIGIRADLDLEETQVDVMENDLFLLCSDGLTTMIPDEELGRILRQNRGLAVDAICRLLVDESNRRGGEDNITVIIIRVGKYVEATELPPADLVAPAAAEPGSSPVTGEDRPAEAPAEIEQPVEDAVRMEEQAVPPPQEEPPQAEEALPPVEPAQPEPAEQPEAWEDIEASEPAAEESVPPVFAEDQGMDMSDEEGRAEERDTTPPSDSAEGFAPAAGAHVPTSDIEGVTPKSLLVDRTTEGDNVPPRESGRSAEPAMASRAPQPAGRNSSSSLWIAVSVFGVGVVAIVWLLVGRPATEPAKVAAGKVKTNTMVRPKQAEPVQVAPTRPVMPVQPSKLSDNDVKSVRTALPRRIDGTLETGEWGAMSAYVDKWSQSIPELLAQSGKGPLYSSWFALWKKMRDGDVDAVAVHRQYRDEVAGLCRKAGFDLPPEEPDTIVPAPPELRADTGCRLMYKLQKHLTDNVRAIVKRCGNEVEALGPEPAQSLAALQSFTGDGDDATLAETVARAGRIASDVNKLDKWLNACGESQITLTSIKMVPAVIAPRMIQAEGEQRAVLGRRLEMIPGRVKAMRGNSGADLAPVVERIEKLYEKVLGGKPASDAAVWQEPGNCSTLRDLLDEIRIAAKLAGL